MRNFVVKHDFNRGGAHKSLRDYTRLSNHDLLELMEEDFGVFSEDEEDLPLKDPKQWESSNKTAYC